MLDPRRLPPVSPYHGHRHHFSLPAHCCARQHSCIEHITPVPYRRCSSSCRSTWRITPRPPCRTPRCGHLRTGTQCPGNRPSPWSAALRHATQKHHLYRFTSCKLWSAAPRAAVPSLGSSMATTNEKSVMPAVVIASSTRLIIVSCDVASRTPLSLSCPRVPKPPHNSLIPRRCSRRTSSP